MAKKKWKLVGLDKVLEHVPVESARVWPFLSLCS